MKIRSVVALIGLAISFAFPIYAQDQNAVDPQTRQEIEAVGMHSDYLGMEYWPIQRPQRKDLCS
jgi:hypothetical protein